MRGEYLTGIFQLHRLVGSSPLARGILIPASMEKQFCGITPACAGNTYHGERKALQPRITPAYAGNTRCSMTAPPRSRDHPRLRGEYRLCHGRRWIYLGSPPLTRGIPMHYSVKRAPGGITPAYAGKTPESYAVLLIIQGSPPLARGKRWFAS